MVIMTKMKDPYPFFHFVEMKNMGDPHPFFIFHINIEVDITSLFILNIQKYINA